MYGEAMPSAVAMKQTRRSQQQRRTATRAALLDAALECLVEFGYDKTTTGLVAERAGLSRGAHLHHFGTRASLVSAALTELARRREDEFERQIAELPSGPRRIGRALDLLWSWYTEPLFYASVDLGAAARTDPELRASLEPVERHLNQTTLIRCRGMFAAGRQDSSRDQLIQLTLSTIRGLALLPVLQPGTTKADTQWKFARAKLLEMMLEEG
jgi:AcrR family transcriptional regulator